MAASLFTFNDYRIFLKTALEGRGEKLALSQHLSCQSAYISRVLAGQADLSLEQAFKSCSYFKFTKDESEYFINLVSIQKAGTQDLRRYYKDKALEVKERATAVAAKINPDFELSGEEKAIFYSSWEFGAICMLTSIHGYQTKAKIQKRLNIPLDDCSKKIDFMLKSGILRIDPSGNITPGSKRLHLDKDSDLERGMQISWRLKAMESFSRQTSNEIRFSALYTLSDKDIETIREILIEAISKTEKVTAHTQEETLHALCIDWFKL